MSDSHQSRWDALTEIARRCVAEKQFDKAEDAFLAALREAEQFGDGDSRVAATLNALARVYHRRSKFFPAAALLHRLLGIKEREHGEHHPELAGILSNLAEMYARLGDTRQEFELRSRALEIRTTAGESDGGALDGLRARIVELREKLDEETSLANAARTSPRQRIRVPTGVTDLPLILPTPLSTAAQRTPFAPAFAPLSQAAPWAAPGTDTARAAPRPQRWATTRTPTPSPVPRAAQVSPTVPLAPTPVFAPAPLAASPTPAFVEAPAIEPLGATVTPAFVDATDIEPLGAHVTPAKPLAAMPLPIPLAKPFDTPLPMLLAKPLDATPLPMPLAKPIAPVPLPAPMAPAPLPAPMAPPSWQRLAPAAPTTSWPGSRVDADAEPASEPDEYIERVAVRRRRNWRPIATGAVALALAGLVTVLIVSRPETSASSTGQVEVPAAVPAQPPFGQSPIGPIDRTVREAMEIGLANLEQAALDDRGSTARIGGTPLPPQTEPVIEGGTEPGSITRNAAPSDPRLRVALPTVSLRRVSDSIASAMQAKVDSTTQESDQTVLEYKGKKPRQ